MSPRFGPESPPRIRQRLPALNVELELHHVTNRINLSRQETLAPMKPAALSSAIGYNRSESVMASLMPYAPSSKRESKTSSNSARWVRSRHCASPRTTSSLM